MKIINLTLLILISLNLSCSKSEETEIIKYVSCTKAAENEGQCIRWFDRKIYLSFADRNDANKNNEFQKQAVKDAFLEIESITSLGDDYFSFEEVDSSLINPIIQSETSENEYKSFVLIWPDSEFNEFIVNELNGNVPDQNAVAVINAAYKRKYFMIIKASCFVSSANCGEINTDKGLRALIARQLGRLVGMENKDCGLYPEDVMCADSPSDDQWEDINQLRWINSFNTKLETINNNPNFYDEISPTSTN
tara:strand:- start:671 stop:1420 length:750 start_codon:yes stop_codon:yes gene_type:complete